MKAGSYAAEPYEPRQVREEAAVNRSPGCRRATWLELAGSGKLLGRVEGRCTTSKIGLGGEVAGSLLTQTRRLLRQFDLRARKGLGQHFLIDGEVLKRITSAAELAPTDVIVEVGPGLGVLTRELAQKAGRVIAIELDNKLAAALKQTLAPFNNVTIINDDVLKIEPAALATEQPCLTVVMWQDHPRQATNKDSS